jgi:NADPH:quinone reductase-like Zn-dependent oxidoreductase
MTCDHHQPRIVSQVRFDYRDKVLPVIREAAPLVADGTLVVPVAGVYPLEHIQDAVQHLLRGGKILLKVAGR